MWEDLSCNGHFRIVSPNSVLPSYSLERGEAELTPRKRRPDGYGQSAGAGAGAGRRRAGGRN
jgi:hypothetical protein